MATLERNVERKLTSGVKALGGWAIKGDILPGFPDRIVLLPGGRLELIELKRVGGRLSKIQIAVHKRLERLGFPVLVLTGMEEVNDWLETARLPREDSGRSVRE